MLLASVLVTEEQEAQQQMEMLDHSVITTKDLPELNSALKLGCSFSVVQLEARAGPL